MWKFKFLVDCYPDLLNVFDAKYTVPALHDLADCSLAQRANPFSKVAHISTPAFVLTDLLTNCAGRGVTGRYETP